MTLGPFGGVNAGYVLELYERYRQNPESVDPATREAFESWTPTELDARGRPERTALPAAERATPPTSTSSLAPRTSPNPFVDTDISPRTSIRWAPSLPATRPCPRAHTASPTRI